MEANLSIVSYSQQESSVVMVKSGEPMCGLESQGGFHVKLVIIVSSSSIMDRLCRDMVVVNSLWHSVVGISSRLSSS